MNQLKLVDMYNSKLLKFYYKLYRNQLPCYFDSFLPTYGTSHYPLRYDELHLPHANHKFCEVNAKYQLHKLLRAISHITNSYSEFCNSIITEMEKLLPVKYVTVNTNTQKKRYNWYKPWWTEKLTELWDVRCAAERGMSGGTNDRQIFIKHQRNFDQEARSAKRHYWYQQQQELLETRLSTDFWKTMGRIGISQSHTHSIPW